MGGAVFPAWAQLHACRSILFVPGDRPERYSKALAASADAICIDLEDAVAPERKTGARASVVRFLANRAPPSGRGILVRVNDPCSSEGERDVAVLRAGDVPGERDGGVLHGSPPPHALMIPKVTTGASVRRARELVGGEVPLIAFVETVQGLENAAEIASSRSVAALVFGGFDLSVELGAEPEWEPLLYARSRVVHAAALAGKPAIDMPSRDLGATDVLRDEAERARRLGYSGKAAIHPAQIPVIHEAFTPSREEVRRARRIVEADRAAGGGAVALDGNMVDRPVVEAARRVLGRAGARP